jgi:hypothetical protein
MDGSCDRRSSAKATFCSTVGRLSISGVSIAGSINLGRWRRMGASSSGDVGRD